MTPRPIGIAVIGTGRAGMIHARSFAGKVPGAQLVGLCDPNEEAVRAAAAELGVDKTYTDHTELFKDPDLDGVVIVTPTKFHAPIAIEAMRAGKHVLCEKPMAMTVEECRAMIDVAQETGRKLQIGFMRRFDAGFQRAKELIAQGAIGEVVSVKSTTHGPSTPQPWMYDISVSNGPLAEVSSHDIDSLRWLTDADVTSVHMIGGNYRSEPAREDFPDFYDTFLMTATMSTGAMGLLDGAQGVQYGYDVRTEILGTDGRLDIGDLTANRVVLHERTGRSSRDIVPSWRNLFADAYIAEDAAFAEAIRDDAPVQVTGIDGLRAVQIVNAGNESLRAGSAVDLVID